MRLFTLLALVAIVYTQGCTMSDEQKADCGYFGINQQQC